MSNNPFNSKLSFLTDSQKEPSSFFKVVGEAFSFIKKDNVSAQNLFYALIHRDRGKMAHYLEEIRKDAWSLITPLKVQVFELNVFNNDVREDKGEFLVSLAETIGFMGISGRDFGPWREPLEGSHQKYLFMKQVLMAALSNPSKLSGKQWGRFFKEVDGSAKQKCLKEYIDVLLEDIQSMPPYERAQKVLQLSLFKDHLGAAEHYLKHSRSPLESEDVLNFFKHITSQNNKQTEESITVDRLLPLVLPKIGSLLDMVALKEIFSINPQYQDLLRELEKPLWGFDVAAGLHQKVAEELNQSEVPSWINYSGPWQQALPLAMALQYHQWDTAELLVQKGADLQAKVWHEDFKHPVPLMVSMAIDGNDQAMTWLLKHNKSENKSAHYLKELNQPYALKKGFLKSVSPLVLIVKKEHSQTKVIELMMEMGVNTNVIPASEWDLLLEAMPSLKDKVGKESVLGSFSRHIKVMGSALKSVPTIEAQDRQNEVHVMQELQKRKDALSQEANSADSLIEWSSLMELKQKLSLEGPLKERQELAFKIAKELSESQSAESLVLLEDDRQQLKRLWERSMTILMKHALTVPKESRGLKGESSESVLDKLGNALESSIETMALMKQRAIVRAQRKMDMELAVIFDKQQGALSRFNETVEQLEHQNQLHGETRKTNPPYISGSKL